jgi:hypothetical protein
MFTLGKTPYPGIEPGERFYDMLVKGYRQVKRCKVFIRGMKQPTSSEKKTKARGIRSALFG